MSNDISDERLEPVVRRAVRAELRVLGERLFWTLLATIALYWGLMFIIMGLASASSPLFAAAGIVLVVLALWRVLQAWNLPPFGSPTGN
ncbi:hypothetical protein [Haladaptatus caseinilyticus]|uniref:hypothetical protein n=1 Tax=Haladaptatus caseinilyticus TaxID=2993314 RepID=UPI00224ACC33|nr:hypothetical protein [Haladaptatus caseinilyticus]